jgi:thiol-disulfide isomerase/thioredoxin
VKTFALLLGLLLASAPAPAAEGAAGADAAWSRIETLRAGPGQPPEDAPEEVVRRARTHLAAQEQALADFLHRFPGDPRRHEAELEYAGVTATLGASLSDRQRVERALQRLAALERAAGTPSQLRADAAFQRITTTMQTVNLAAAARPGETGAARNTILESAQNFAARYPEDRRAARLLAEAATLFDDQAPRKRRVLEQAATIARDDGTRQRIRDDLQRIELLGQPGEVRFPTVQGGEFSLPGQRGRVVVLIFWAGWSPPSVAWLAEFAAFARGLAGPVTIATYSLDRRQPDIRKTLDALKINDWPTGGEGRGWDEPLARELGINALPTVFVYDKQGRLRALNARQSYPGLIRQLLAEKPPRGE